MNFYLEKSSRRNHPSVVIRGKSASGKPYRIFVKFDSEVLRIDPKDWIARGDKDFDREKYVRRNPTLNTFLKQFKKALEDKVISNKINVPHYSIPDAWNELYGKPKESVEKPSEKIVEAIQPFINTIRGNKSAGYLRHFDQLETELKLWNADITFSKLNEISLNSYLTYLKGAGLPERKALKSATISHHFKHLRQVAKYASQCGITVDPLVFAFNPGKVIHELGCFDLTYEELMILWHYQPTNRTEEIVLDYSLLEAFTGIRNGDLYSLKAGGAIHGILCGDISPDCIAYRDRKNDGIVKTVTRHKFNERIISKYLTADPNALLLPPIAQQTCNQLIKEIAKKAGLTRSIRRGNEMQPLCSVISSHCFRSSYANLLYRLGLTSEMIGEELGHAATSVTVKHYLKFADRHELVRVKVNALEIVNPNHRMLRRNTG